MHTKTYTIRGLEWRIHYNSDFSGQALIVPYEPFNADYDGARWSDCKIPGELLKAIAEDMAEEKIRKLMEMAIDAMRMGV